MKADDDPPSPFMAMAGHVTTADSECVSLSLSKAGILNQCVCGDAEVISKTILCDVPVRFCCFFSRMIFGCGNGRVPVKQACIKVRNVA